MSQKSRRCFLLWAIAVAVSFALQSSATAADWKFTVQFRKSVHRKPYTGRVYLFFSKRNKEPRRGPSWFTPEFFIAKDVKNWEPGSPLEFSAANPKEMLTYSKPLAEMELAGYFAQAVVRFNPFERRIGTGAGNGYSDVQKIEKGTKIPPFVVKSLVPPNKFKETKWVKELRVKSELLSKFHGRDVSMSASVRLPASYYSQPKRRYPTMFTIPGFGGTHRVPYPDRPIREKNKGGVEFLRVQLDASCPLGHHVFANSANNGPVGTALIKELIPAYEKAFRAIANPKARFLTGHSSGGWSSLWLQVTNPDDFGGTWSTAPDPVDFRDYQRINLYKPGANMYVDEKGKQRPIARKHGKALLWYKGFSEMEWVLGYGGQLHSFEAAFSPRGKDGKPKLLYDRRTGKVDTAVAKAWRDYDISLILRRNWKTLGPKLKGKLHVFMGSEDTFYLDGAAVLLKKALDELPGDAVVEIHKGKDHGTLMRGDLPKRIRREMVETYLKNFPTGG